MRGKILPYRTKEASSYLDQLCDGIKQPYDKTVPTCYQHISQIAESVTKRQMTEAVIVVVPGGVSYPEELSCICCRHCPGGEPND